MRGRLLHLIGLAVLLPLPLLAKEPTRLAVVDVGVSAKVPAMFLDLLMVELGKHAEPKSPAATGPGYAKHVSGMEL